MTQLNKSSSVDIVAPGSELFPPCFGVWDNSTNETLDRLRSVSLSELPISDNSMTSLSRPPTPELAVFDVYELAASIGREFELIIGQSGSESVASLMPKLINVLEELEDFAERFNSDGREIVSLRTCIERMESEIAEKNQYQSEKEKNTEQLLSTWQSEVKDLNQILENLKLENEKLKEAVNDREKAQRFPPHYHLKPPGHGSNLTETMMKLKELIDRQSAETRSVKQQLTQRRIEFDAMHQQTENLVKLTAKLRHKHCIGRRSAAELNELKSDIEFKLAHKEDLINKLQQYVRMSPSSDERPSLAGMSESLIKQLESPNISPSNLTESQLIEQLNTDDQMFTFRTKPGQSQLHLSVGELRSLLTGRYQLQAQLVDVEEELDVYRRAGDEGPPVQGPINREPNEKDYPDSSELPTVKQFFENLLSKFKR